MDKRNFKKYIRHACGEIAIQCIIAQETMPGIDYNKMNEAIIMTAALQSEMLSRSEVSFDKIPRDFESKNVYNKSRKAYFKKAFDSLEKTFLVELNNIVSVMNQALPKVEAE